MARTNKSRAPALAYLRTSSAANVGTDKDSEKRQRHAIQGFARWPLSKLLQTSTAMKPTNSAKRMPSGANMQCSQ